MIDEGRSAPVTLTLISDFELRCDDEVVPMPRSSQRLICYLALQNRALRRGHVSSTLWLESTEAHANASLRSALWRIPALGGRPVVAASNTHVWLASDVRIDLHRVIARARSVLDGTASIDGMCDVVAVARELCAFGDEVLPGWFDDWVIMERERFRQLRLHALDDLGERLVMSGRYADASQVALSCVQSEPLRESAHRLLVRVHLCEGNIAEAIRQYRRYADLLREELGAQPSRAMRDLVAPCLELAP